jgi:hypothetical protein
MQHRLLRACACSGICGGLLSHQQRPSLQQQGGHRNLQHSPDREASTIHRRPLFLPPLFFLFLPPVLPLLAPLDVLSSASCANESCMLSLVGLAAGN